MQEEIKNMIYEIRGKKVMLDSDLAKIYNYETKNFNRQVKNNIERFDSDFMFSLTNEEYDEILRCKNFTSSLKHGGRRYNPYVFTEQGIYMLMTVLKGEKAITQSKILIRVFKKMKDHIINNNIIRQDYINNMVLEDHNNIKIIDNKINLLHESFCKLEDTKKIDELYFRGKIYDAYSKVMDIFKESKEELIIVDRFTDKTILDMIKDLKVKVILITGNNTKITKLDIDKYNSTYNNLNIYYSDIIHDRYIIIDRNTIYHSGNSINYIGYRGSSIDIMNDKSVKAGILNDINSIINYKDRGGVLC